MLRKRIFWIGLIIVLALAGGGYGYYRYVYLPGQEPEETLMTARVARGDLIISISGTGVLSPASERGLGFETDGYLDEVLVGVGDRVQEGDLLARLETGDLELALAEAEINLRQAQLDLADATEEATEAELAAARAAVESARAALTVAQYSYENAQKSDLDAGVRATQIKFQYAVDQYWEAKEGGAKQGSLQKTWDDRAAAEYDFNQAVREAQMEELEAWNQVDQAQNRVLQTQEALASLESGPDEETVLRAELKLARAELALEEARDDLGAAELRAPFEGVVVDVSAIAGERVGAAAIITLADLDNPRVKFWVEESDASGVAMGNRVEIEFEGLPDEIFTGTVTRIDPALVTVNGTLAVQAWASLDLSSRPVIGMSSIPLLGEMNADVEVISAEARDVVLVPVQALREIGEDQYAVFVVQPDGELAMHPVGVGLMGVVNAEIVSGLEAGPGMSSMPVVSLGEQSSTVSSALEQDEEMPGPPGGMIPGGGMFGGGGGRP